MKKNDLVLIAAVLIIAAAIFITIIIYRQQNNEALYASIVVGTSEVCRIPLNQDAYKTIETEDGVNIIVVNNGECFVESADCYNQICVNSRSISNMGESIVCMPHKLAVTIVQVN